MSGTSSTRARVVGWSFALLIALAIVFAVSLPPLSSGSAPGVSTQTPSLDTAVESDSDVGGASGIETIAPPADTLSAIAPRPPRLAMESATANLRQPILTPVPLTWPAPAGVITRAHTTRKVVAFTFDFDMTPNMLERLRTGRVKAWYDPEVLRVLDSEQVPSTFFIAGLAAVAYPDLMRSLAQNPLVEIGNHSNRHFAFAPRCYTLPTIPDGDDVAEVEAAQQNIREATAITPAYFRFPGGCYEAKDVEIITHLGLTIVQWDVASSDAFNQSWALIVRRVMAQTRPGSIVLFHVGGPNAPQTANALKVLIPYFKAQGYTFLTLSQLLTPEL